MHARVLRSHKGQKWGEVLNRPLHSFGYLCLQTERKSETFRSSPSLVDPRWTWNDPSPNFLLVLRDPFLPIDDVTRVSRDGSEERKRKKGAIRSLFHFYNSIIFPVRVSAEYEIRRKWLWNLFLQFCCPDSENLTFKNIPKWKKYRLSFLHEDKLQKKPPRRSLIVLLLELSFAIVTIITLFSMPQRPFDLKKVPDFFFV